ncbi:MAG: hypothetical protein KIH01_01490 [Candidatus Freyarchaeota archaeon]|nr:hypothetical protein [Candidatus Jordarchaeia archaeon]
MQRESTNRDERPFWLDPPWSVLIDPSRAGNDPWSIDVAELIISFLEKMREMECLNYWISGKALLSASIIHRLKSELLLQLAYERNDENGENGGKVERADIPPIPMPFRITSRKVTLAELLFALQQALLMEAKQNSRLKERKATLTLEETNPEEVILEALHEEWDVEAKASEVYSKVVSLRQEVVTLSILTNGNLESVIETFLALLFLAFKGVVHIWQEKPGGEIYVMEGEKWRKMLRQ